MANTMIGVGDRKVAADLYASAILTEAATMAREGMYVCLANIEKRLPAYNVEILRDVFWMIAREGGFNSFNR